MTEFRIHIGAHKTATTHFQDSLSRAEPLLRTRGIGYIPRSEFRGKRILAQVHAASDQIAFSIFARITLEQLLERNKISAPRILISEEDILGSSFSLMAGMYPQGVNRLRQWKELLGESSVTVFLSIRNYRDILPSAYSQGVRDGALLPDFDHVLNYWKTARPSWCELIQRIQTEFAHARLVVWSFEKYIQNPDVVINKFVGCNLGGIDVASGDQNSRMTLEAIQEARRVRSDLNLSERRREIERIVKDKKGRYFDPLSPVDKATLNEWYLQDCAKINNSGIQCIF